MMFYITAVISAISLVLWYLFMKNEIVDELNSPAQSRHNVLQVRRSID